MIRKVECKECQVLRRSLEVVLNKVVEFQVRMDLEMEKPASMERGRRIAMLANQLTRVLQAEQHFAMRLSFEEIEAKRSKIEKRVKKEAP